MKKVLVSYNFRTENGCLGFGDAICNIACADFNLAELKKDISESINENNKQDVSPGSIVVLNIVDLGKLEEKDAAD